MTGCCSHRRRITVHTRAILDFNFSAAPLGSEPCTVTLMFENTGTVATDWWVTHTWRWLMSCAHTILTSELLCSTLTGEVVWCWLVSMHTWHQLHWWESNQDSWKERGWWMCFVNSVWQQMSKWFGIRCHQLFVCSCLVCVPACLYGCLSLSVLVGLYPVLGFVRTDSGFRLSFRAFLFPCDLHLELEYWAETGEFDEDELHEVRSVHTVHPTTFLHRASDQESIPDFCDYCYMTD